MGGIVMNRIAFVVLMCALVCLCTMPANAEEETYEFSGFEGEPVIQAYFAGPDGSQFIIVSEFVSASVSTSLKCMSINAAGGKSGPHLLLEGVQSIRSVDALWPEAAPRGLVLVAYFDNSGKTRFRAVTITAKGKRKGAERVIRDVTAPAGMRFHEAWITAAGDGTEVMAAVSAVYKSEISFHISGTLASAVRLDPNGKRVGNVMPVATKAGWALRPFRAGKIGAKWVVPFSNVVYQNGSISMNRLMIAKVRKKLKPRELASDPQTQFDWYEKSTFPAAYMIPDTSAAVPAAKYGKLLAQHRVYREDGSDDIMPFRCEYTLYEVNVNGKVRSQKQVAVPEWTPDLTPMPGTDPFMHWELLGQPVALPDGTFALSLCQHARMYVQGVGTIPAMNEGTGRNMILQFDPLSVAIEVLADFPVNYETDLIAAGLGEMVFRDDRLLMMTEEEFRSEVGKALFFLAMYKLASAKL
jgi:hypothetical protein